MAAEILGISRGTLERKLTPNNLMDG
ncbi:helix-turn-helix domain-containing protein [Candidatus Rariloculus sp.]